MAGTMDVTLGSPNAEFVRLMALGREHEGSDAVDDANWLVSRIAVRVSGFRADYPASLRSDDFAQLREALVSVRRADAGDQRWEPLEPWISLSFEVTPDVVGVRGVATERIGYGNSLHFEMPFNRDNVDRAIHEIDELLAIYPVPK